MYTIPEILGIRDTDCNHCKVMLSVFLSQTSNGSYWRMGEMRQKRGGGMPEDSQSG